MMITTCRILWIAAGIAVVVPVVAVLVVVVAGLVVGKRTWCDAPLPHAPITRPAATVKSKLTNGDAERYERAASVDRGDTPTTVWRGSKGSGQTSPLVGVPCAYSRSAADGRVELELQRRWLPRLVGRSWSPALGPVRYYIVGPAAPIRDPPVQRLDRQAVGRVAGDERVEAPS
jgi:hypothetical protein